MHLFSLMASILVACMGVARVAAAGKPSSSGVVEVDVAFPRNQTYAPTKRFSIVFAIQNPEPAAALNMHISYEVWDGNMSNFLVEGGGYGVRWANFSSADPFLKYGYSDKFNTEGRWRLVWHVHWSNCTEGPSADFREPQVLIGAQHANRGFEFTTSHSAPAIDLVAATDNQDCSEELGVTIDVTDTLEVPSDARNWHGRETCAVVAASAPPPEPCRVKLDPAATSSMAASLTARVCNQGHPFPKDIDCPTEDKSAAHRLAVGSVACLAVVTGALGYLLRVV